jgi:hypothetical protein
MPQGIKLLTNGNSIDETSNPAANWKLLQGNFTLSASGTVEISIEFHILITTSLSNGAENYSIDNILVRRWSNPEPTHGTWTPETAWTGPPLGDINGDGKVDIQDLHILGQDYGKQYP